MSYDPLPPFRRDFDAARDPYTARNALGIPEPTGGGGPPAPIGAEYITGSADATLTNERVLTNTATVTWDFSTAGQAKANVAVSYQPLDATLTALAAYNTNGLLTQTAPDTFTGRTLTGPAAGISVSNGNGVAGNPTLALADDLAALEALAGTDTIYYRSGTSAWSGVTIGSGLAFGSGTLSATATTPSEVYQNGRLEYVSATALVFKPFNGNKIKTNGTLVTIPAAGMSIPNTNIWLNNTSGQNLAANTTYWIFAWYTGGTLLPHFWTPVGGLAAPYHAPSQAAGNEGVETWYNGSFIEAYTLIGMCRTNASSQFVDTTAVRGVLSWFNRRPRVAQGKFTADRSTSSTTLAEINSEIAVGFLTWAESSVLLAATGYTWNSALGNGRTEIYVDAAALEGGGHWATSAAAGYLCNISQTADLGGLNAVTEGYHTATLYGAPNGGTQSWSGTSAPRCALTAQIWG